MSGLKISWTTEKGSSLRMNMRKYCQRTAKKNFGVCFGVVFWAAYFSLKLSRQLINHQDLFYPSTDTSLITYWPDDLILLKVCQGLIFGVSFDHVYVALFVCLFVCFGCSSCFGCCGKYWKPLADSVRKWTVEVLPIQERQLIGALGSELLKYFRSRRGNWLERHCPMSWRYTSLWREARCILEVIIMEICKAPTPGLKALNKCKTITHIMYIEMENVTSHLTKANT